MTQDLISMTEKDALERIATLSTSIQQFLTSKGELVDITLNALLSAYLSIADTTGRLQEVPPVLLHTVEAIVHRFTQAQATKH